MTTRLRHPGAAPVHAFLRLLLEEAATAVRRDDLPTARLLADKAAEALQALAMKGGA